MTARISVEQANSFLKGSATLKIQILHYIDKKNTKSAALIAIETPMGMVRLPLASSFVKTIRNCVCSFEKIIACIPETRATKNIKFGKVDRLVKAETAASIFISPAPINLKRHNAKPIKMIIPADVKACVIETPKDGKKNARISAALKIIKFRTFGIRPQVKSLYAQPKSNAKIDEVKIISNTLRPFEIETGFHTIMIRILRPVYIFSDVSANGTF
jgi:hypothetical protein